MNVRRGDIYYADLSPVIGSEQGGIRPVLIVQNDIGNKYSPTVIAAAITSRISKSKLPTHIEVYADKYGLARDSVILLEQIRTLDKGDSLKISCEALKDDTVPAVLTLSEQSRRFADMMKMYGNGAMGMPTEETLVLNTSNALVEKLYSRLDSGADEATNQKLALQIYSLALIAQRPLEAEELAAFISRSTELLSNLD